MATDALLTLQTATTRTSTGSGAWLDLQGTNVNRRATLSAHIFVSDYHNTSGANSVVFSIDHSPDNGSTIYSGLESAVDRPLTLTATVQGTELWIPFGGNLEYVRLTCTVSGAGAGPSVTYSAAVELGNTVITRA